MDSERVESGNSKFYVASHVRVLSAAITDLLVPAMTLMCIFAFLSRLGVEIMPWVSPVLGLTIFVYMLLARRNLVFSIGNWGFCLRRLSYASIKEYSGKGALYVVENVPEPVLFRRAISVGLYLGLVFLLLSVVVPK